jgi:hypothetical protein
VAACSYATRAALAAWVLAATIPACGPRTSAENRSPSAELEPERSQKADEETAERIRREREAERNAFRKLRATAPQ